MTHAGEKFELRILGCWGGDDGQVDSIGRRVGASYGGPGHRRPGGSRNGRKGRGLGPGYELGGKIAMASGLPFCQRVVVAAGKALQQSASKMDTGDVDGRSR